MYVAVVASLGGVYVFALEVFELYVAARDNEIAYDEDADGQNYGAVEVGSQHAAVADAATEDGYNLGVAGHA